MPATRNAPAATPAAAARRRAWRFHGDVPRRGVGLGDERARCAWRAGAGARPRSAELPRWPARPPGRRRARGPRFVAGSPHRRRGPSARSSRSPRCRSRCSAAAPRRGRIAGRFSAARLRLDDDRARGLPVRRGSDALALGIQELVEEEREIRREERKRIARDHLLKGPMGLDRRREPLGRVGEAAAQESSESSSERGSPGAQLRRGRIERGPSPGHQLHQDRAERIDVGLFGEPTVGARLRRDVRRDLGRHPAAAEGRQDAVGDPEASDANDGVVGNRHEPGPQHAMEREVVPGPSSGARARGRPRSAPRSAARIRQECGCRRSARARASCRASIPRSRPRS